MYNLNALTNSQKKTLKYNILTNEEYLKYLKEYNHLCFQLLKENEFIYKQKIEEELFNYFNLKYGLIEEEYCILRNENKNRYKRLSRCKKKISYLMEEEKKQSNLKVLFITFTFNNKKLSFKMNTRRQNIRRLLSKYCIHYVANIDFGSLNEREHYHAVVLIENNKIDFLKKDSVKMGFSMIKECKKNDIDIKRLTRYINKLTNHAFKETGRNINLIYDRNIKGVVYAR